MDSQLRALFGMADAFVSSIGKCMAGELATDDACMPLLVPIDLWIKMEAQLRSMTLHRNDVKNLGRNIHFAPTACELNRANKCQNQYLAEKAAHQDAATHRHNWDDVLQPRQRIALEELLTSASSGEDAAGPQRGLRCMRTVRD